MEQTLRSLEEEFLCNVTDLQVALLALECLERCEEECMLTPWYGEGVPREYRRAMQGYIEEYAEALSFLAVRIAERCTGREWDLSLRKKSRAAG